MQMALADLIISFLGGLCGIALTLLFSSKRERTRIINEARAEERAKIEMREQDAHKSHLVHS